MVTSLGISAAMSAPAEGGAVAKSTKAAVTVSPSMVSAILPGEEEAVRVAAAEAVGIVVSSAVCGEKTLMSDDPKETAVAEVACAVAPSMASTFTSGGGGVANVSVADVAVAVASSATLRRMYERKEDMRPAVGGGAVTGSGPVSKRRRRHAAA